MIGHDVTPGVIVQASIGDRAFRMASAILDISVVLLAGAAIGAVRVAGCGTWMPVGPLALSGVRWLLRSQ
ncbi:MAG: hypothetical protein ACRDVP_00175 [Acidimicrobiales bacterium]